MKYEIQELRVDTFKTGERAGEWRPFALPETAVILDTHIGYLGEHKYMRIVYAIPEQA